MKLTHDGVVYEIENWDEFSSKLLNAIGFQIIPAIQDQIKDMKLIDTSNFWQSFSSHVEGNTLTLESSAPYAAYLEFGTYDFGSKYSAMTYPNKPVPKKKNMSRANAMKLPRGMAPFSPCRRVLYNQQQMNKVINKAVKWASK